MTKEEAIDILGLPSTYTEDEAKAQYALIKDELLQKEEQAEGHEQKARWVEKLEELEDAYALVHGYNASGTAYTTPSDEELGSYMNAPAPDFSLPDQVLETATEIPGQQMPAPKSSSPVLFWLIPVILLAGGFLLYQFGGKMFKGGSGKQKTAGGLEYEIIDDAGATKAAKGDYLTLHFTVRNYKDSVLHSSHAGGGKPEIAFLDKEKKEYKPGSMEEVLFMFGEGDSAVVYINSDSVYDKMPPGSRPAFIPKGTPIKWGFQIVKVENQEGRFGKYKKEKNLTTEKTKSGLEIAVTTPGTGPKPAPGDTVEVAYTGKFLDGNVFDASERAGRPYRFPVGESRVIPGWDEGLLLLNQGSKATFLIPSDLAYGTRGMPGAIPPNSPLVFDVELVSVTKAKAAAPAPAK